MKARFIEGSGNVYTDLGLANPDTRLAKAELARCIAVAIQERSLTQQQAAELLQIDQPKVSAITRGRLADFSLERLMTLVNRLGMNIDIVVSENSEPERAPHLVVQSG